MAKKLLSLLLTLALTLSLFPAALAEDIVIVDPESPEEDGLISLTDAPEPLPADEPEPLPEEERPGAESLFAAGRGAAESWSVSEPNANSGQCGDKLFWLLYEGTLTVSGTGAMWDFTDTAPGWYASRSNIKAIVVEEGVKSIGLNAFVNCADAASVSLPESLLLIGNWAFENCTALKKITVPRSVQVIGSGAFAYDSALTAIEAEAGSLSFASEGGVLFTAGTKLLHSFPAGKSGEYTVAADVTAIYDEAFEGCEKLTALKGGSGLQAVGVAAFYGCGKLTSVSLGSKLQTIGAGAFYQCGIQQLNVPDGVTEIGSMVCYRCDELRELRLGNSVREIGTMAFYACKKLQTLILPDSLTTLRERAFESCFHVSRLYVPASVVTVEQLGLPNSYDLITAGPIGSGCDYEFGWTEAIPDFGFYNMWHLQSVELPKGLKTIGHYAFCQCSGLSGLSFPVSLSGIGMWAFNHCLSLTEVTIPPNVTNIGREAFSWCTDLRQILFLGSAPEIGTDCFYMVHAYAVYPPDDPSWSAEVRRNYGGTLTWLLGLPPDDAAPPKLSLTGVSTAGAAMSWTAVPDAAYYKLVAYGQNETRYYYVEALSFLDSSARMGERYHYQVCALTNSGWTNWSEQVLLFFNPFADVSGTKTIEYVAWAYNNNIVKGTAPTSFSPDASCSRVQFIMMLWKMAGSPVVEGENPFRDVKGAKTTKAILWALERGIINSGTHFYPDENISRIQIVMILWKMYGSVRETIDIPFTDVSGSKTLLAIRWAYKYGITTGTSDTTFSPDDDCTRLQLVIFLNRCSKYRGPY